MILKFTGRVEKILTGSISAPDPQNSPPLRIPRYAPGLFWYRYYSILLINSAVMDTSCKSESQKIPVV